MANVEISNVSPELPETEFTQQAAQLWGLTDAELAEIQRSLKELTE